MVVSRRSAATSGEVKVTDLVKPKKPVIVKTNQSSMLRRPDEAVNGSHAGAANARAMRAESGWGGPGVLAALLGGLELGARVAEARWGSAGRGESARVAVNRAARAGPGRPQDSEAAQEAGTCSKSSDRSPQLVAGLEFLKKGDALIIFPALRRRTAPRSRRCPWWRE